MKKSDTQVVEVKLSEAEARQRRKEEAQRQGEHRGPDQSEGRRPPVPGVSREEALQVNDDEIGRTVKPFNVQDYRNIRPMNSPDLFKPVPDAIHREIEPQRVEETEEYEEYEEISDDEPEIGATVQSIEPVAAEPVAVEPKVVSRKPEKISKAEKAREIAAKQKPEPVEEPEPKRKSRKKNPRTMSSIYSPAGFRSIRRRDDVASLKEDVSSAKSLSKIARIP